MTNLPDDIDQLKAMLLEFQQQNEAKDKLLAEKQEEVAELTTKVQLLVEQLNLSKSKRFASQSEKKQRYIQRSRATKHRLKVRNPKEKTRTKPLPEELVREETNTSLTRHIVNTATNHCTSAVLKPLKN